MSLDPKSKEGKEATACKIITAMVNSGAMLTSISIGKITRLGFCTNTVTNYYLQDGRANELFNPSHNKEKEVGTIFYTIDQDGSYYKEEI